MIPQRSVDVLVVGAGLAGLRAALDRFAAAAPGLVADRPADVERRGGPIPVGGLLRRIGCAGGLLVGMPRGPSRR